MRHDFIHGKPITREIQVGKVASKEGDERVMRLGCLHFIGVIPGGISVPIRRRYAAVIPAIRVLPHALVLASGVTAWTAVVVVLPRINQPQIGTAIIQTVPVYMVDNVGIACLKQKTVQLTDLTACIHVRGASLGVNEPTTRESQEPIYITRID
jgi:hypothetical protein